MRTIVLIPAFNEQDNIVKVINDIANNNKNIDYIIIDDCSTDDTVKVCKEYQFNYISLPLNLGIGGGVQTGYKYALENDYDIAIQFDGDGQHDAKFIPAMLRILEEDVSDIVIGSRYINNQGFQSTKIRRFGIKFLSLLIKVCAKVEVKDVTSGYRAVNKKFIRYFANSYAQDYPEPEAIVNAKFNNARIVEIPVTMRERENGVSSINFRRSVYYVIKVSLSIILSKLFYKK